MDYNEFGILGANLAPNDASAETDNRPATQSATAKTEESVATGSKTDKKEETPTTDAQSAQPEEPPASSLDFRFVELSGQPIEGLRYRIDVGKKSFPGNTDGDGCIPSLEGLTPGDSCKVYVRKDDGYFKLIGETVVPSRDAVATLTSPSLLFECRSDEHGGEVADRNREPPPKKAKPEDKKKPEPPLRGGGGKVAPSKKVETKRDDLGHPQVSVARQWIDWLGEATFAPWHYLENVFGLGPRSAAVGTIGSSTSGNGTSGSGTPAVASPQLLTLIELAEEQTKHSMPHGSTHSNLDDLAHGKFQYGDDKPQNQSSKACYMYVKIVLWRAKAVPTELGGNFAKVAGGYLTAKDYRDVTVELPDARWALPGDVIVYRERGDTEIADSKGRPGHIDIRSYHYYVADFERNNLYMNGGKYEVVGVFRKEGYYDAMAGIYIRAFLKVLRSREAEAFFKRYGDDASYKALPGATELGQGMKDFSTHPTPSGHDTSAGAYQIKHPKWVEGQKLGGLPADFSPRTQDRYAVWIMESRHDLKSSKVHNLQTTALGYLRQGDVEKTVALLLDEWSCLPGAKETREYTMQQLKSDFGKYIEEYVRKG